MVQGHVHRSRCGFAGGYGKDNEEFRGFGVVGVVLNLALEVIIYTYKLPHVFIGETCVIHRGD